jgi:hypothetical protein
MDSRYPHRRGPLERMQWQRLMLLAVPFAVAALFLGWNDSSSRAPAQRRTRQLYSGPRIKVFSAAVEHPVAQMQRRTLSDRETVELVMLTPAQQQDFLQSYPCIKGVSKRYQELRETKLDHLAQELWKYCALSVNGGMYLDSESPLLASIDDLVGRRTNIAVWGDSSFSNTLHGSFLLLRDANSPVATGMLQVLMDTPLETLQATPLLLPRALNDLVQAQVPGTLSVGANENDWWLLEQRCSIDPLRISGQDRISSNRPDSLRYVM